MFVRPRLVLSALVLCGALATDARADGFGISFGKHGKHKSVDVHVGWNDFPSCAPRSSGHWDTISEKIWVAPRQERVWKQAEYETRYDHCGRPYTVCVRPARWENVCVPGHYEWRERRVWVESRGWRTVCN